MEWLWVVILVLFVGTLLGWSAYNAYRGRIRRKAWEAKVAEARRLVRPIVEKSYAQLTGEIRSRWPLVPFDFRTLDDLMANVGNYLKYGVAPRQNIKAFAKKVLDPVVSTAVKDFMNYNPVLSVSEQVVRDKISAKFSAYNDPFRITKDVRSPPDWAERRKVVYDRDGGCCRRCGVAVSLDKCHIHHLIRRSEGGHHSLENLVTLCRDCHSLMPEHQKVDGGPFYTSHSGYTLHTEECHHAARRISGSLPSLLAQGYTPCMKCMPMSQMRRLSIERFARARLSAIVNSMVVEYE